MALSRRREYRLDRRNTYSVLSLKLAVSRCSALVADESQERSGTMVEMKRWNCAKVFATGRDHVADNGLGSKNGGLGEFFHFAVIVVSAR